MVRRKQERPQARLGPVEARTQTQDGAETSLRILQPNASPAFDLEAWEEAHALDTRPRKKSKNTKQKSSDEIVLFEAPQPWEFAILDLEGNAHNGTIPPGARATLRTDACRIFLRSSTQSAHWESSVCAPSSEVADSFCRCLIAGHFALRLVEKKDRWAISVSMTDRAFTRTALSPEDQRTSALQQAALRALQWLVSEADLDPEHVSSTSTDEETLTDHENEDRFQDGLGFDAAELYTAVKPTGREPELCASPKILRPTLRGYQRRAAGWMVARELSDVYFVDERRVFSRKEKQCEEELHPLWRRVDCLPKDRAQKCFYINPFTGLLALERFAPTPGPKGGIAADEMGLGKTVELLALIMSNPYPGPPPSFEKSEKNGATENKPKERIDCPCSFYNEDASIEGDYTGLWVQCTDCLAWQHGQCVGYRRRRGLQSMNKDQKDGNVYVCGRCLRDKASETVTHPCGTTLIVCPAPILQQWTEEIARHVVPGTLKVMVYEGQVQPGSGSQATPVTAADLAAADIVLTTYDVLRRDLHHCSDTEGGSVVIERKLRRCKRYVIFPTPLTRLKFWRVAIDEAQMVESSTAKAAAMACKLQTEHRWCVTGTPISRGLEDLHGLMAFLQVKPYSSRYWWMRCIQRPYESGNQAARQRLMALLKPAYGGFLWRSAKADVASELGLPPQHHHLSRLEFSAIERHFYNKQHQDCVGAARSALEPDVLAAATVAAAQLLVEAIDATPVSPSSSTHRQRHTDQSLGSSEFQDRPLTAREEHKLLRPLLRLRQACVHPQIGAGGIRALSAARAPMTMSDVLQVLLGKAKVEAEEAQRALLASLNGLAGLMQLEGAVVEAVRAYREALATANANKELIRADKLQQLHTLHNLAALLETLQMESSSGAARAVPRTLRDAHLREEAASLRDEYLTEPVAKLALAEAGFKEVHEGLVKLRDEFIKSAASRAGISRAEDLLNEWYIDAIHLMVTHSHDGGAHVVEAIQVQLAAADKYRFASTQRNAMDLADRFRDLFGLHIILKRELEVQSKARIAVVSTLHDLSAQVASPPPAMVELAATCGKCRGETKVKGRVCDHCELDEKFKALEVLLFSPVPETGKSGMQGDANSRGNRSWHSNGVLGSQTSQEEEDERVFRSDVVNDVPSQAEQALRMLASHLRGLKVPEKVVAQRDLLLDAAKAHLEVLEGTRREFFKARVLARAQRVKLYALDELEMCVMRMQLRLPGEPLKPGDDLYKLDQSEVPIRSTELSAEKAVASAELKRCLGTVRYLLGLKASQDRQVTGSIEGSSNDKIIDVADAVNTSSGQPNVPAREFRVQQPLTETDPCPVCQEALSDELMMFPCGHRICCRCHVILVEKLPANQPSAMKRVTCPTCRARAAMTEVAYVDARRSAQMQQQEVTESAENTHDFAADNEAKGIKVNGSYGTKIEAIVRRLIAIHRSDSTAKTLVFSTWKDALEILSHALTGNALPHAFPREAKNFNAAIAAFRGFNGSNDHIDKKPTFSASDDTVPRILLLQTRQGGNGLNLQQAHHVIFMERLLDPAAEAQAIGRVDRIGQTHATHVHRFVILRSVEENVHRLGLHRAVAMDMAAAAVKRGGKGTADGGRALTLADVGALLREETHWHSSSKESDAEKSESPPKAPAE